MIGFLMFKKGSKLYSVFSNKCPRCQEGDFFKTANHYKLKDTFKMYDNCPNCNLKYMIEPSFFYGAMYVTYALTVIIAVLVFGIDYLMGLSFIQNMAFLTGVLTLLTPISLRISRLIYINIFIHFDASKAQDSK
ncbi:MAG: DUF983 domain-containing protein [Flavobacteriaceae bacterium]